ncbi:hypothetical protein ABGB12_26320 [Actinocorallia sp. B10E7]|uniref:HAAS signaling domain-containing protein n=1 Tax=Actinocorallia sp. B10E7 TaxID=3153558 RepID=UPI00325DBD49
MITTPVSDYAAAVRAALTDVPEPDRSELLEDLEDHLTEVAGESDEPLEARLGTPESYAAELHAAYLQRPDQRPASKKKPGLVRRLDARVAAFHTRVGERYPGYETARNDFRPAWWLLRGYLVALAFWTFWTGNLHHVPWSTSEWLLLLLSIGASVFFGYRMRDGRRSYVLVLLSLCAGFVAVVAALFGLAVSENGGPSPSFVDPVDYQSNSELANVYPYTKDGKPLKDVLLYDQNGRPVQLPYELYGYQLVPGPTPQIPNSYPLSICNPNMYLDMEEPTLVPRCSSPTSEALPSITPAPAIPPTDAPTASPSTPEASPTSPSPSSSPTE